MAVVLGSKLGDDVLAKGDVVELSGDEVGVIFAFLFSQAHVAKQLGIRDEVLKEEFLEFICCGKSCNREKDDVSVSLGVVVGGGRLGGVTVGAATFDGGGIFGGVSVDLRLGHVVIRLLSCVCRGIG